MVPLISRDCLEKGYHIEEPRKTPPTAEDFELIDADRDVKFFEQLVATSGKYYYYHILSMPYFFHSFMKYHSFI